MVPVLLLLLLQLAAAEGQSLPAADAINSRRQHSSDLPGQPPPGPPWEPLQLLPATRALLQVQPAPSGNAAANVGWTVVRTEPLDMAGNLAADLTVSPDAGTILIIRTRDQSLWPIKPPPQDPAYFTLSFTAAALLNTEGYGPAQGVDALPLAATLALPIGKQRCMVSLVAADLTIRGRYCYEGPEFTDLAAIPGQSLLFAACVDSAAAPLVASWASGYSSTIFTWGNSTVSVAAAPESAPCSRVTVAPGVISGIGSSTIFYINAATRRLAAHGWAGDTGAGTASFSAFAGDEGMAWCDVAADGQGAVWLASCADSASSPSSLWHWTDVTKATKLKPVSTSTGTPVSAIRVATSQTQPGSVYVVSADQATLTLVVTDSAPPAPPPPAPPPPPPVPTPSPVPGLPAPGDPGPLPAPLPTPVPSPSPSPVPSPLPSPEPSSPVPSSPIPSASPPTNQPGSPAIPAPAATSSPAPQGASPPAGSTNSPADTPTSPGSTTPTPPQPSPGTAPNPTPATSPATNPNPSQQPPPPPPASADGARQQPPPPVPASADGAYLLSVVVAALGDCPSTSSTLPERDIANIEAIALQQLGSSASAAVVAATMAQRVCCEDGWGTTCSGSLGGVQSKTAWKRRRKLLAGTAGVAASVYVLQSSGQRAEQGSAIANAINANFCSAASTSCTARASSAAGVLGISASSFISSLDESAFWAHPYVRFVPSLVSVYTDATGLVSGLVLTNGEQGAAKRLSQALLVQQPWNGAAAQLELEVKLGPGDAVSTINAVQDRFGVHYVTIVISDGRTSSIGNASYWEPGKSGGPQNMAGWNSSNSSANEIKGGASPAASPAPGANSIDGSPLLIAVSSSALGGGVVGAVLLLAVVLLAHRLRRKRQRRRQQALHKDQGVVARQQSLPMPGAACYSAASLKPSPAPPALLKQPSLGSDWPAGRTSPPTTPLRIALTAEPGRQQQHIHSSALLPPVRPAQLPAGSHVQTESQQQNPVPRPALAEASLPGSAAHSLDSEWLMQEPRVSYLTYPGVNATQLLRRAGSSGARIAKAQSKDIAASAPGSTRTSHHGTQGSSSASTRGGPVLEVATASGVMPLDPVPSLGRRVAGAAAAVPGAIQGVMEHRLVRHSSSANGAVPRSRRNSSSGVAAGGGSGGGAAAGDQSQQERRRKGQ